MNSALSTIQGLQPRSLRAGWDETGIFNVAENPCLFIGLHRVDHLRGNLGIAVFFGQLNLKPVLTASVIRHPAWR